MTKVTDRDGRIRVQVTEGDIARAEQKNSMRCVVAQALARTIPDASRIDVDIQSIRWSAGGERHVYLTPYAVQGYVVAFDAGDQIEPFSFSLDSRKRMPVKKQTKTAVGTAISRANGRSQAARKKRERVAAKVEAKEATPELLEEVTAEVDKADRELASVKAAYEGQRQVVLTGEGRANAVPRVHRTSTRTYGHRVLRVNQQG
jgi:hypothetical protein